MENNPNRPVAAETGKTDGGLPVSLAERPVDDSVRQGTLAAAELLPEELGDPDAPLRWGYSVRKIADTQDLGVCCWSQVHLLSMLRGTGSLTLDSGAMPLRVGTMVLLGAETPHRIQVEPGGLALSIRLANVCLNRTLYRLLNRDELLLDYFKVNLAPGRNGYVVFLEPENYLFLRQLWTLLYEVRREDEYERACGYSCLVTMFAGFLRRYRRTCEAVRGGRGDAPQALVPAILMTIRDEYRTVTLSELARQFGYNESYLSVLLKRSTGRNFTDLVSAKRLAAAKELLSGTNLAMEEIARQTGFGSAVHFSRSFHRVVGETPGAYRKRMKK